MSRLFIVLVLPSAVALTMAAVPAVTAPVSSTFVAHASSFARPADGAQAPGRYKQQGNVCEWDAKDNGPNQCEPIVKGRFKKGANDSCAWNANEAGADECRPPKGRWKGGNDRSCAWDGNDSGPDQCNPRRVK